MHRWRWAVGIMLLTAAGVRADRVPSQKTEPPRDPGSAVVVAVPVTTNGIGNLGVYQGVAFQIYARPVVNDPRNPGARPVYNLPFYGASLGFGDAGVGVVTRPKPSAPH